MIDFDKGRVISNVLISTAFGHSGGGMFPYNLLPLYRSLMSVAKETGTTILSKSATFAKRRGNFIAHNPLTWKYIRRIPYSVCGMVNAYGLTNSGVEKTALEIWYARQRGFEVIPNFFPEFDHGTEKAIKETLEAVEIYKKILPSNFWAIEINLSCSNAAICPRDNAEPGILCVEAVKKRFPEIIVIAKTSYLHTYEFVQGLVAAGADVIHAINTIPYDIVFPGQKSPLPKGGGGVSGDPAFQKAFEYNRGLREVVSIPLIFGCGVSAIRDVYQYFDIGANAVSICSLAIRLPYWARLIIAEWNKR